jgi:Fic family protein
MIGGGTWIRRPYNGPDGRYGEYSSFVPDPIAQAVFSMSDPTALNALIDAEVALRVWSAEPAEPAFEALLTRLEAVSSCEFEGITASSAAITEAFAAPGRVRDENLRLILGNAAALERAGRIGARLAGESTRSFTVDDILALHADVMAGTRSFGGHVRTETVWIGGYGSSPMNAVFVPPPADQVTGLLEDLAAFVRRTDLPTLWQAAVAHTQFETIHPFGDGNGRTGRALIAAIAAADGLRMPPFSAVCLAHRNSYIGALTDFRTGNVDGTVLSINSGLVDAVYRAAQTRTELEAAVAEMAAQLGSLRAGSAATRALIHIAASPLVEIGSLASTLGVSFGSASNAVEALVAHDLLRPENANARMRRWRCRRGETLLRRIGA